MASIFCFMDICWLKDGSGKAPKHNVKWVKPSHYGIHLFLTKANGRRLT